MIQQADLWWESQWGMSRHHTQSICHLWIANEWLQHVVLGSGPLTEDGWTSSIVQSERLQNFLQKRGQVNKVAGRWYLWQLWNMGMSKEGWTIKVEFGYAQCFLNHADLTDFWFGCVHSGVVSSYMVMMNVETMVMKGSGREMPLRSLETQSRAWM